MRIFYKIEKHHMSDKHFYKMHRFVFFEKFIFTIDIYPSETNFGFMLANRIKCWHFYRIIN